MTVENSSGRDVDYDVKPSDPGGGGGGGGSGLVNSAALGLLFSSLGTTFAAVGCLTGLGDQGLVLAGLGLLAAGLVFQGVTLERARRLAAAPAALIAGDSGKKHLKDQESHGHVFVAGAWVNFWEPGTSTKLAQSPKIFDPSARVILRWREYVSAGEGAAATGAAATGRGEYFVEVT